MALPVQASKINHKEKVHIQYNSKALI